MKKKKKVLVAMSGGADSSVSAFLLQKRGYEVMGVFMRLGLDEQRESRAEDAARNVCQKLGIKFYPFDLSLKFKKEVIDYFVESYSHGFTPNPCVKCNKKIKFGELLKLAQQLNFDYLATGHYVINKKSKIHILPIVEKKRNKLLKSKDNIKDQSYFLYNLTGEQLQKIIFPLGKYTKEKIKKIAKNNNLPVLEGESQDICFLSGDHNDFLRRKIKAIVGEIKTLDGKIIGKHQGLPFYTLGQRRGIEIGGTGPYYVVKMDYKNNILYVSNNKDDPALYSKEFVVDNVNWINSDLEKLPLKCEVVIRYGHKPINCIVFKKGDKYLVKLNKSERAITPGQSAVFYHNKEVLGGGVIMNN